MTDFQSFKEQLLNGHHDTKVLNQVQMASVSPQVLLETLCEQIDAAFGRQFHVGVVLAHKVKSDEGGMVCRGDADMLALMLNVMRSMEKAGVLGAKEKEAIAKGFGILEATDADEKFEKLTLEVSTLRNAIGRLAMFATTDVQKAIIKNAMSSSDEEAAANEVLIGHVVDGVFKPIFGGPSIDVGNDGSLFVSWGTVGADGRIPISVEVDKPSDLDETLLRQRIEDAKS